MVGAMTKVEMLQEAIVKLDRDEFAQLYKWMLKRDGKRDEFVEAVRGDPREGKTTKIDSSF